MSEENLSDRFLLKRVRAGDEKAFELLFKMYYPRLEKYVYRFSKDHLFAEDLVQEVFERIWLQRQSLKETCSLKSYLFTMVHNKVLNEIKHQKVTEKYLDSCMNKNSWMSLYEESFLSQRDQEELQKERLQKIEQALEGMPNRWSDAFRLSKYRGLQNREIAEYMGVHIKSVEKYLSKALMYIRSSLLCLILYFIQKIYFN